jgi:hypothetical protein
MIRATIEHGAMGLVPKSSTPEILIQALAWSWRMAFICRCPRR